MSDGIEIYIRHSGGDALLHAHVPFDIKNQVVESLKLGDLTSDLAPMTLELMVLPEWISDPKERKKYESKGTMLHLRIPIARAGIV